MENLFKNKEEYFTFCNLLAKRRLNNLKKENDEYDEEIDEALNKCIEIFNKYGEDSDYLAELLDLEDKLQNVEENENMNYSNVEINDLIIRRKELRSKLSNTLENISSSVLITDPRTDKEDLEFYIAKILDRKKRKNASNYIISEIKKEFDSDIDVYEAFNNISVLADIKKYQQPEVINDITQEETELQDITNPYVKKISSASDELLNQKNEEYSIKEEENEQESSAELTSFEPINIFKEEENVIPNNNENTTITDVIDSGIPLDNNLSSLFEDDNPTIINTIDVKDETSDEVIDDTVKQSNDDIEIIDGADVLKVKINGKISLRDLAETACDGNIDGWKDIYEANKNTIDKRILELYGEEASKEILNAINEELLEKSNKEIINLKDKTIRDSILKNNSLLIGLTLDIPNVYNHLVEETNNLSLSMAS